MLTAAEGAHPVPNELLLQMPRISSPHKQPTSRGATQPSNPRPLKKGTPAGKPAPESVSKTESEPKGSDTGEKVCTACP